MIHETGSFVLSAQGALSTRTSALPHAPGAITEQKAALS
jgi:hypothetical protein